MFSTSKLLVEHLIAGLMALVWISLLMWSFSNKANLLGALPSNNILITAILIAFLYPIGLIIDFLAERILKPVEKGLQSTLLKGLKPFELVSSLNNSLVTELSTYLTFKLRIYRSGVINFFLISITWLLNVLLKGQNLPIELSNQILLAILMVLGAFTCYLAWKKTTQSWYTSIAKEYYGTNRKQTIDNSVQE
jgi:hypothetical protein